MPLDGVAAELRPNDEYYLKPYGRLYPLFRFTPEALANSLRVAERCGYQLLTGGIACLSFGSVPAGARP